MADDDGFEDFEQDLKERAHVHGKVYATRAERMSLKRRVEESLRAGRPMTNKLADAIEAWLREPLIKVGETVMVDRFGVGDFSMEATVVASDGSVAWVKPTPVPVKPAEPFTVDMERVRRK